MVLLLDFNLLIEVIVINYQVRHSDFTCCESLLSIGVKVLPHHLALDGVHHESLDIRVRSRILNGDHMKVCVVDDNIRIDAWIVLGTKKPSVSK
jgi:hypothetical protein